MNSLQHQMNDLLKTLLNSLDQIGQVHPEVYEPICRETITEVVFNLFVKPDSHYRLPDDLGIDCREGNQRLRSTLLDFCDKANELMVTSAGVDFRSRLTTFQSEDISSDLEQNQISDFFVWLNPYLFDEDGNIETERAD